MKTIRRPVNSGYTLTEILLALMIFGIAVAGLFSLFPAVHFTEKESREETRSALIASGILDALQDPESPRVLHVATGMQDGSLRWESVDPSAWSGNGFKTVLLYDSSCRPMSALSPNDAERSQTSPEASSVVTLGLSRRDSITALLSVEVAVSSPASAPAANRSVRRYVKLIRIP